MVPVLLVEQFVGALGLLTMAYETPERTAEAAGCLSTICLVLPNGICFSNFILVISFCFFYSRHSLE